MTNEDILANAPDENLTHYDGNYYWQFTNYNGWCRYCNPIAKTVVSEPSSGMRALSDIRRIVELEKEVNRLRKHNNDMGAEFSSLERHYKRIAEDEKQHAEQLKRERDELESSNKTLHELMVTGEKRGIEKATEEYRQRLESAERERDEAHKDACFYKSCALSGEVPVEGSQPSAKN